MRTGDLSELTGTMNASNPFIPAGCLNAAAETISASCIDPVAARLVNLYPLPTCPVPASSTTTSSRTAC
jgi:hypothetical protein